MLAAVPVLEATRVRPPGGWMKQRADGTGVGAAVREAVVPATDQTTTDKIDRNMNFQ